ncbi:hypothetical protein, variant [Verruconis gallopava]|uniref:C2H2-type domain-containing protein n=1 Tax=Verruconis gallopava TaxID=253628 RepID=A0A0D1YX91_9PEZI|nr:hypothetical protein, variant [Verruconis gallopava]KIW05327.1 hypothetical protein, variant [Verruconis gallopava]
MLALDLRRQHHHTRAFDHHPSPALLQPHIFSTLDALLYSQSSPSPSIINSDNNGTASGETNKPGYLDAQSLIDSSSQSQAANPSPHMTGHFYQNPAIRVQQSSPAPGPQLPQSLSNPSPYDNWSNTPMMANRSLQAAAFQRNRSAHQRAQSSSSMGSNATGSPYSQGHPSYGYSLNDTAAACKNDHTFSSAPDQSCASPFSNHLPTPSQTPTQESFLSTSYPTSSYPHGGDMNGAMSAHLTVNNNIDHHSNADEDIPGMSHSGRQSVSSLGQDPSTPRTIPENYDDGFKIPSHDQQMRFPKLDRTVSDAYSDALFSGANIAPSSATSAPKSTQLLSPHRNIINEYLQAAQIARSQSPASTASRGVSPFRAGSPFVQGVYSQMQRPYTAASVRQAQQARASQMEMSQHMSQRSNDTPKTISPKDAVLDYSETEADSKMPPFSESEASQFDQQFGGGQQNFSAQIQNISRLNPSSTSAWTNDVRQRPDEVSSTDSASFNFTVPTMTGYAQSLPFSSQAYRAETSTKQEETPEFPAHLTSMDSSASEAPASSTNSNYTETTKPVPSTADSGTYTCTFHGCNLRFETPQKLQKHKREGHRNTASASNVTPGIGSGMTSAQLAARNSQSGPHKCERINPTTGKPCNTIFSRPYDLTRHEDTIHNARKQKVRCALCVEDKTFSRNDALTRHMRVVHPEVDFPGKHRRRGAHD